MAKQFTIERLEERLAPTAMCGCFQHGSKHGFKNGHQSQSQSQFQFQSQSQFQSSSLSASISIFVSQSGSISVSAVA